MTIELLEVLIKPPERPIEVGNNQQWKQIEDDLGFIFPEDYKACVNKYGSGSFSSYLWPLNPFTETVDYKKWVRQELENYLLLKKEFPDWYPFVTHPLKGGLFPCAISIDRHTLFWKTDGESENWSIIVYASLAQEFEQFTLSFSDFLIKWISGSLKTSLLPMSGLNNIFTKAV